MRWKAKRENMAMTWNHKPRVELIYASECPNADAARNELRQALAEAGSPADWTEWDRNSPDVPAHVRHYGSPTVLVDGWDVAGQAPSGAADSCRIYRGASGYRGTPGVPAIMAALGIRDSEDRPAAAPDELPPINFRKQPETSADSTD